MSLDLLPAAAGRDRDAEGVESSARGYWIAGHSIHSVRCAMSTKHLYLEQVTCG